MAARSGPVPMMFGGDDLKREMDRARIEGTLNERLTAVEKWNDMQNGRLLRVENKIDKMLWMIVAALAGIVGTLAQTLLPHVK